MSFILYTPYYPSPSAHLAMPQPKWFIKDDERGIDQEKWLVDYIEATIVANRHRVMQWKAETAAKFEEQFPRDIPKKLYKGKGKRKRFDRMETAEEVEERTCNRNKVSLNVNFKATIC